MLAIVVLYNTWGFCSAMTLCIPLHKYWNAETEGTCKPAVYMWAVLGLHVATDFLIFLLPLPVVLSMKALSRRQRTGLLLIFALGFLYVFPLGCLFLLLTIGCQCLLDLDSPHHLDQATLHLERLHMGLRVHQLLELYRGQRRHPYPLSCGLEAPGSQVLAGLQLVQPRAH